MSTPQPPSGRPPGRVARAASSVSRGTWRDMDQGWYMAAELVSGLLIFGGLGWWVGTRFGGHPYLFIAGSLIGFSGGFYVLYLRAAGRIGPAGRGPADDGGDDGGRDGGGGATASEAGDTERS